jgi:hypothetical protein
VTLTLRKTGDQARIEGLNADIWAEHGYAVVEPDINKRVGRIYPDMIRGDLRWPCWFLEEKKIRWPAEADRLTTALRSNEAPPIGQNARGLPCRVPFAIASIVVTLAVI